MKTAPRTLVALLVAALTTLFASETSAAEEPSQALRGDSLKGVAALKDTNVVSADNVVKREVVIRFQTKDSLVMIGDERVRLIPSIPINEMNHSPHTATMYAAILPGLGQIYNKKYWKLPLLYGGAAALGYAIHFNNKYYKKYSSAYRDFLLRDPNNKSYMEFATRAHLTEEDVTVTYAAWFQRALNNKKNYYRRYRDLSIFGMIGLYVVQIVDACVDAHFFYFDVSDDLSFNWRPEINPGADRTVGVGLALNFK